MKYELQHMRQQGSGAIVNCSSLGGLVGGAERGSYHAAKHGVLGLTKSAALEYATRNIRVNAVCPGLIWTPMVEQMVAPGQKDALDAMVQGIPMHRHGRPEERMLRLAREAVVAHAPGNKPLSPATRQLIDCRPTVSPSTQ